MSRYLRKVDGSYVCRDDGQTVTNAASHAARWHSLSPRPHPDAADGDTQPAAVTYAGYVPLSNPELRGPMEVWT